VTPDYVLRTALDKSWALATLANGYHLLPDQSDAFPSPLDLCESLNAHHIEYKDPLWQQDPFVQLCLKEAHDVAADPFRCVVASLEKQTIKKRTRRNKKESNLRKNDNNNQSLDDYTYTIRNIYSIGAELYPTVWSVMERVDWGKAIILSIMVAVLTFLDIGTQRQHNQYKNGLLYLMAQLAVKYFTTPSIEGLFSGASLSTIVPESYHAFRLVHPMDSHFVALSHFATYWFPVALWRSKSLRNMLVFGLLYETVTGFVNEWMHHGEHDMGVRCMRLAFIGAAKHYAFDDLVREYILPPFFVYGYLLPTYVLHWVVASLTALKFSVVVVK
jgi:hypothetical protein